MSVKKVDCATLDRWVGSLVGRGRVVGVQARGDRFVFAELKAASDLRLDYDVTILPPKEFLQPPCETLLTFSADKGYASVESTVPTVLLGVHPYDIAAIGQMDKVFEMDHCDTRYVERRAAMTIVAVDAQGVAPNSFAGFMGTAHVEEGFDILLTRTDVHYVVDIRTDKGKAIAGILNDAEDADEGHLEARAVVWKKNDELLKKHTLAASPDTWSALLDKSYDNEIWSKRAEKCFSCGSCTLTCPTCYCFDVRENVDWSLKSGTRERVWDGCMLPGFALVAGGHNFRKDKTARYRHRYYRKGKYVPSRTGVEVACVGCGRCIGACVAKIANPVEVFNALGEGV